MPTAREGGEHDRGTPLSLRGVRGSPRGNFEFLALLHAFLMGSRFFARKDISWRVRSRMLNKMVFR